MKTIGAYSKVEEAYLAASKLEASGIQVRVVDGETVSVYWLYSNAIGGVKLQVSEADEEEAREILDLPAQETGLLVCPHCGSAKVKLRGMSVFAAISIAMGLLLPFKSRKVDCMVCRRSFSFDGSSNEEKDTPDI